MKKTKFYERISNKKPKNKLFSIFHGTLLDPKDDNQFLSNYYGDMQLIKTFNQGTIY